MPESSSTYSRWKDPLFWGTLLFGSALRIFGYNFPGRQIFDEIYYVAAAEDYVACLPDANSVHPPLAKIQMALIEVFGDGMVGGAAVDRALIWRLPSLVFGLLILWWTHRLAWAVTRSRWISNLTLALVAIDFLSIVQSRIAMLDQIQAFWILAGFTATAEFIFRPTEDGKPTWSVPSLVNYIGGASLCFGIATACKWNGFFAALGAFLAVMGMVKTPVTRSLTKTAKAAIFLIFLTSGISVYAASYLPYVGYSPFSAAIQGPKPKPKEWNEAVTDIIGFHRRMLKFRYNQKEFVHRYLSYFYEWPLMLRPVWYFYEDRSVPIPGSQDTIKVVRGIVGMGSVVFWWPAFFLMLDAGRVTVVTWLVSWLPWRRKATAPESGGEQEGTASEPVGAVQAPFAESEESARDGVDGSPLPDEHDTLSQFAACMYFPQWLLWAAGTTGGFIYYMVTMIPAMALVVARYVEETRQDRVTQIYLFALLVALVLYYPLLIGVEIPEKYFHTLFPSSWI